LRIVDLLAIDSTISWREIRGAGHAAQAPRCSFCRPIAAGSNPIEQLFAKLKTLLRQATGQGVEATWTRIGALLGMLHRQGMRQLFP